METSTMFERLHSWRAAHVSTRQMTLILSFTIGVLASVAAFILHSIIHEIQILLTGSMRANSSNWLFLIFPIVGIYLTYLFIKYVFIFIYCQLKIDSFSTI